MNNALHLPRLPSSVRMADYFGTWLVDAGYARGLAAWARQTDLQGHVQAHADEAHDANQPIEPDVNSGLAVLRVDGLMMKHASSMTDSTSTVRMRQVLRELQDDSRVAGVMLVFDSPGGTAAGTEDLAQEVAAFSKPIYAYVEDMCASAAYYVASQCDRVFANNRTAKVGSIGTMMALYDTSNAAQDAGIEALLFVTGPLKGTGFPGAEVTDDQRAYLQQMTEDTQASFDAAVMGGRGFNTEQLQAVKTGGVWLADRAVELGLIDGIASFDDAISQLADAVTSRQAQQRKARFQMSNANLTELRQALPGADSDFLLEQIEKGSSIEQAQTSWIEKQQLKIEAADATITDLQSEHAKAIDVLKQDHAAKLAEQAAQVEKLTADLANVQVGVNPNDAPEHNDGDAKPEKRGLQSAVRIAGQPTRN